MEPRIVFMGSPEFALPCLEALADNYPVVGVVTQPDRPAGRGRQLNPPAVKTLAQSRDLPVIQPRRLREPEAMDRLRTWRPDLIVVAAFGQILPPAVLEIPAFGAINVHASLLPRWRGAAPVQAAILNGDQTSGITIMQMDPGLDTGPILNQATEPIKSGDTAATLSQRLATLGAQTLLETIPAYLRGDLQPIPQDKTQATYAPMLKKSDGELILKESAKAIARKVRAFNPWPGTFITWNGQMLKIHRAHPVSTQSDLPPGKTTLYQEGPALTTGEGLLVLDEVQPAGKKPMPGEVFLHGARHWVEKF
jgi:methionyl-tRNA formyltransferase